MAGTTNLQQWNPTAVNQETDAQYLADAQRAGGATDPSLFASLLANKVFYQSSTYLFALFTAFANKGFTTSDSNASTLTAQCANFLTTADVRPNLQVLAYAPNITLDASLATGFEIGNMAGPCAITIVNYQFGDNIIVMLAQDTVGGRTVTWASPVLGGSQPDPTPGVVSVQMFKADSASHLLAVTPMYSFVNGIVSSQIGAVLPARGGFTTLSSTGLSMLASLQVAGAAILGSLQVFGTTILGTLSTAGLAVLASLQVTGTTILGTLTAGASLLSSLQVTGTTILGTLTSGTTNVGSLQVAGAAPTGSTLIGAGTFVAKTLTVTDVTSTRSIGTVFQNNTGAEISASGWCTTGGSAVANVICTIGPANPPTIQVYQQEATATFAGGTAGFVFVRIPPGWFYSVTTAGDISGLGGWAEMQYA